MKKIKKTEEAVLKYRKNNPLTYLDLFRYKSVRKVSICSMLIFFSMSVVYFVPNNLANQFGFNFYLNGVLLYGT